MCLCARMQACVCVCVTNNRLQGNCRGLQWLWAGPRHHPSIWRWGWIQFDIPVCLRLHHYGLKLAGSDRLRRQVAWCRRGSLRLYFRVKYWIYQVHYMSQTLCLLRVIFTRFNYVFLPFYCSLLHLLCAGVWWFYVCLLLQVKIYSYSWNTFISLFLCKWAPPPNVWFPWSAAQHSTASSPARETDRPLSVVFLLLCWSLGGVKGLLLFSSGTFIIQRPTQPDQIRAGEEEAGMFVRVRVKLDLNSYTFGVKWYLLLAYTLSFFNQFLFHHLVFEGSCVYVLFC